MKSILTAGLAFLLLSSSAALGQVGDNRGTQLAQNGDREGDRDSNEVRGTPHWERGDRLPSEYRGDQYAVENWQAEHLRKPPRGYHWVRVGDRYLMVEQKNGMIRDWREAEIRH